MPILKNPRREKFAKLVAGGMNLTDAYTQAYNSTANRLTIGKSAHNLRRIPIVDARIQELLEGILPPENEMPLVSGDGTKVLRTISREEIEDMLIKMLTMSPSEASMDNPLCDLRYVGKEAIPVPMTSSRVGIIERLSKMKGLDSQTIKVDANEMIVDLCKGLEDA